MSEDENELKISRDQLPALYLAASKASQNAQKWYLRLIVANLSLLVLSTLVSSINYRIEPIKSYLVITSAVLLIGSIVLTIIIQLRRLEKDWYGGRAIAESVKTLAWRYITGAFPYEISLSESVVDKMFSDDLTAVLKEKKFLSGALGGKLSTQPQITDKMRWARKQNSGIRKEMYLLNRIKGQQEWYGANAETNKNKERNSFIAIITSEVLALVGLVFLVKYTDFIFNPVGLFATLATSILAWLQVKQYQELSQSYGLAAQELGIIFEESKAVKNNQQLSEFVLNSENAISREHTMWIARKERI